MAKTSKKKKKSASGAERRSERRFETNPNFMPMLPAIFGCVGALALGVGVFGVWIMDTPLPWAEYVVAGGGLLLGVALWFGQAPESAVTVGDSGIAVEDGREMVRLPWYRMRSLKITSGSLVADGDGPKVRFFVAANPQAASAALEQASRRVPNIIDVDKAVTEKLPNPTELKGESRDIEDDQVTGIPCAASKKIIKLEDDARLCPNCGQIFHKEGLPEKCTDCETDLRGRTLRP